MKKIVLSVLVVGSLLATSCKEVKKGATDLKDATVETTNSAAAATTEAAGAVVDGAKATTDAVVDKAASAVTSALAGIEIPSFANEAVTKNLTEYAAYAKDYLAANGNVAKITALAAKGQELAKKGAELIPSLSKEDQAKYSKTLTAIMSKMAPAK